MGSEKYLFSKSKKYYTLYLHGSIFTTKIIGSRKHEEVMRRWVVVDKPNQNICLIDIVPFPWCLSCRVEHDCKETKPSLTTKSKMAVLVVIRLTSSGAGYVINNYLDGKLIGQTSTNLISSLT